MRFRRYSVQMDFTGVTRKRAAEILGEHFQKEYEYRGESESYAVTDRVGREWVICKADNVEAERFLNGRTVRANFMYQDRLVTPFLYRNDLIHFKAVLEKLNIGGAVVNDSAKTKILLDIAGMENKHNYTENLQSVELSKGKLLRKVLNENFESLADFSSMEEGIVCFPIYKSTLNFSELEGNIQLAEGISGYAENTKRISGNENTSANEKFVMRTWLVRIGMVGEEYRATRKQFTKELRGNSAWLRKIEVEEMADTTIEMQSENGTMETPVETEYLEQGKPSTGHEPDTEDEEMTDAMEMM